MWYAGNVVRCRKDGTYDIKYAEDETTEVNVKRNLIKLDFEVKALIDFQKKQSIAQASEPGEREEEQVGTAPAPASRMNAAGAASGVKSQISMQEGRTVHAEKQPREPEPGAAESAGEYGGGEKREKRTTSEKKLRQEEEQQLPDKQYAAAPERAGSGPARDSADDEASAMVDGHVEQRGRVERGDSSKKRSKPAGSDSRAPKRQKRAASAGTGARAGTVSFRGILAAQGWRIVDAAADGASARAVWFVRPYVEPDAALADLVRGVDYFASEAACESFMLARRLVGCLLSAPTRSPRCSGGRGGGGGGGEGRGGGGGGSGGWRGGDDHRQRGVVCAELGSGGTLVPQPPEGGARAQPELPMMADVFKVQLEDGTAEALPRRAVLVLLDDRPGLELEQECSICFSRYGEEEEEYLGAGGLPQTVTEAVMLRCGHVFCAQCVRSVHEHKQQESGVGSRTRSGRGASIACPQVRLF
jgi:hypothetical protein